MKMLFDTEVFFHFKNISVVYNFDSKILKSINTYNFETSTTSYT